MKKILRLMVLVVWATAVVLWERVKQFKILFGLFDMAMWAIIIGSSGYVFLCYFI